MFAPSNTAVNPFRIASTAQALRTLYFVRAAFSLIWVGLLLAFVKSSPTITAILLLVYPTWDVAATFFDIRANRGPSSKLPQFTNIVIGLLTTVAVSVALKQGVPTVLVVFGAWAGLTGLIQLVLGLRRRRTFGGQWPMILSGGQSIIAGASFIAMAQAPTMGIVNLAGYAAFGAFYFLLAAFRLGKPSRAV
ncbi:hypothetical protein [Hymenobacter negativus]|uniref:hypothetical protein n=1 Tax=Hymenobacter negativus TaxID=2795026 RepID=UPI001F27796B|nr:hypothetical protein [Hymenobacter negativus]